MMCQYLGQFCNYPLDKGAPCGYNKVIIRLRKNINNFLGNKL